MKNLLQFLFKERIILSVSISFLFILTTTTIFAVQKTSAGTGNWNTAGTWTPSGVPANGDSVTIAAGHTVTLNANTNNLADLVVNGTLSIGDGTARTITVSGSVTVASTGTITIPNFNDTHSFFIGGNLINRNVFDMNTGGNDICDVTFNGSVNQTISDTGATTDFNLITIANTGAAGNNIVEIASKNFTVPGDFLTLTSGIFKVSGTFTLSNAFFAANSYDINADEGIWLNNPNVTVTGQGGSVTLSGSIRITAGTYNIGTSSGNSLTYGTGSSFIMEGGLMDIAGRFCGTGFTQTINFNMIGGTLIIMTIGTSTAIPSFDISAAGSSFTMSGGNIVIQESNANAIGDYRNIAGTLSITGGTVQFGNASTPAANDDFDIGVSGTNTLPNFSIVDNASSIPVVTLISPITVNGNIVINTGTTLVAGAQATSVTGNWTNSGTFTAGTGTVTMNGSSSQTMSGSTFNNLTIDNAAGVTLLTNETVNGTLTFTAGKLFTGANTVTFGSAATLTGEGPGKYLVGNYNALRRAVGTGSYNFGGVVIDAGPSIDSVTVTRTSGSGGVVTGSGNSINRTWNITSTVLLVGSRTIHFSWDREDDNGIDTSIAQAYRSTNGGTNWLEEGVGQPVSGDPRTVTVVTDSLSLWTVADDNGPLPVELTSFIASIQNYAVQLSWQTATEVSNFGFDLEKSDDGINWNKITFVQGSGNSNSPKSYSFVDKNISSEKISYRLKQIDTDGKFTYSNKIEIEYNLPKEFTLFQNYPNPFNPSTKIKYAIPQESFVRITLFNLLGEKISELINKNHQPGVYEVELNGSDLSSGVYLYKFEANASNGKFINYVKKMILNK